MKWVLWDAMRENEKIRRQEKRKKERFECILVVTAMFCSTNLFGKCHPIPLHMSGKCPPTPNGKAIGGKQHPRVKVSRPHFAGNVMIFGKCVDP